MQRRIAVVRRALKLQGGVGFGGDAISQSLDHPRLADAGITLDQEDPARGGLGLVPQRHQQIDFRLTIDQGREAVRLRCVEPCFDVADTDDPPDLDGLVEPLKLMLAHRSIFEGIAQQLARVVGDHDRVRRRQGLKACRQVRGRTDDRLVAGRFVADHFARDDQPGRHADADGKSEIVVPRQPEPGDALDDGERRIGCPLGDIFLRGRIAEQHQNAVAHIARHMPAMAGDDVVAGAAVRAEHIEKVFRVHGLGELGRSDEIAEHDRQLTPLGLQRPQAAAVGDGAKAMSCILSRGHSSHRKCRKSGGHRPNRAEPSKFVARRNLKFDLSPGEERKLAAHRQRPTG